MIKAVLFDMDGVLIDSEPVYSQRKIDFFGQYGIHYTMETMNAFAGLDLDEIMKRLFPHHTEEELQKIIDSYKHFSEIYHFPYDEIVNPGVMETLKELRKRNIKTAIVSSSPMQGIQKMIQLCGFDGMFDLIVSGEDYPKTKPDPAVYNAASERLGFNKDEYLVVEDSDTGIASAKDSGLMVAAKKATLYNFKQDRADMVINEVNEILSIIDKLNKE